MTCDCIKLVDEKLAEQNLALDTSFTLGKGTVGQILTLSTHWKDETKKARGKKPTTLVCNFCPFCGKATAKDAKAEA